MSSSKFILLDQKIPESKKDKEWDMNHLLSYVQHKIGVDTSRKIEQLSLWKDYLCITDKKKQAKLESITKVYGNSMGIEWVDYPLIESKLEQLIGEYMLRELRMKAYVLNKRAKSEKLDAMFDILAEDLMRKFNKEIAEDIGFEAETQHPEMELPEDVEEFLESDYKTESEESADLILKFVMEVKKQKNVLKDLLLDFLVNDEVISYIDEEFGSPVIKKANIFETDFDWDPNKEIQDDPQYIFFDKFIAYNQILNEYDLTKEQEDKLKSYVGYQKDSTDIAGLGFKGYDDINNYNSWFEEKDGVLRVRCVEGRWISKRMVRVKVSKNKITGKEITKILPDDYKKRKGDIIKKDYIDYTRICIMVGPDLVLFSGPSDERYGKVDDKKKDTILAVGLRRQYPNGFNAVRSAAKKLSQMQSFASEILWEIRLAMRRNNGRVMVYDASQIPKHFLKAGGHGNAINRVMHHAKKDGFLIINSEDKKSRNQFNQFTSLDMSTKGAMADLFNTLALIEDLASKFIGISPQREGNIQKYDSVGGNERSVAQSTARTEIYFTPFESFVEVVLERILMKAKYVFEEGEIVDFVFGDNKSKFFKIQPPFHQDDFGLYIGNSYKEERKKAVIDEAAKIALGNAQTPELLLQLTEVLNAPFSSEAEKILKRGTKALEQIRKENNEALQAAEAERNKGEAERLDKEHALKREGFEKDIKVAQIRTAGANMANNTNAIANQRIKAAQIEAEYIKAQNAQEVEDSGKKE